MEIFEVAGITYDREAVEKLRERLIVLRDGALGQGQMEWSVVLSHTIGLLSHVRDQLPTTIGKADDPRREPHQEG